MEVKVIDGVRCFVFTKEPAPAAKVSKTQLERERKAVVGRGLGKKRNAVRRPSDCIITTF